MYGAGCGYWASRKRNPAPRQQPRQESGNPTRKEDQRLEDVVGFEVVVDGNHLPISRDVRTRHSSEIHAALGTHTEAELQDMLSQLQRSEWFDEDGRYVGPDKYGLGLRFWHSSPPAPRQQPRQESEHSNPGNPTDAHVGQEMVTVAGHGSGMRSVYRDRRGREYVIIGATRYYQGIHWGAADEESENPAPRRNPPCTHPNLQRTNYSAVNTKENKPEHRGKAIWACGDCGKTLIEK